MTDGTRGLEMDLRQTYQHLLDLNAEAFAGEHYEIAYHLLEAALHCADGLGDEVGMARVQQLAEQQGAWLDQNRPDHRMASKGAKGRGTMPLFHSAARTAAAMIAALHADRAMRRPTPPGPA